jgi:ABC-2 type transport system permease protein
MSAIYILWLRQLKKYIRSKPRIFGSLGQPLLFLLALGFGLGPMFQKAGGGNYIDFLVPGIIAMSILFTSIFSGIELIWDRQFGFLKETLVAPVSRFGIMFGRTLGGATTAVFQGVIVLIISILIGFRPISIIGAILSVFIMALIAILFTALGTAIASKLNDMQAFPLIMNFLVMPLFFLSGALFPLDTAPATLKIISYFDPLTYCVDLIRGSLTGVAHFGILLDAGVVVGLTIIILWIGSHLFSKIEV